LPIADAPRETIEGFTEQCAGEREGARGCCFAQNLNIAQEILWALNVALPFEKNGTSTRERNRRRRL
jgi:hypothetical protein